MSVSSNEIASRILSRLGAMQSSPANGARDDRGGRARLLLANLCIGLKRGHIGSSHVATLFDRLTAGLDLSDIDAQSDGDLLACLVDAMHSNDMHFLSSNLLTPDAEENGGLINREERLWTVLSWKHHLFEHRTHRIAFRSANLQLDVKNARNPAPAVIGAVIRELNDVDDGERAEIILGGEHAIFWVAPTATLGESPDPTEVRDSLGLVHISEDDILLAFIIDHDVEELADMIDDICVSRPTVLDAGAHPAFKDYAFGGSDSGWGSALHLRYPLARALPELDGMPELVCGPIEVERITNFRCYELGRVTDSRSEMPEELARLLVNTEFGPGISWAAVVDTILTFLPGSRASVP
jgi:hypothetical protein